ncbi:MAG TPA: ABC transporter substrate-binding protein [Acidimicrobiales bacterium]|nr:ABC transporter substrate-binding protein [Acidimicrobiales bacterium]
MVLLAAALVAAACGDDDGSAPASSGSGSTGGSTTTLAPQTGGVLAFGEFSEPVGLDPIVSTGHGTTGAIEMAAVYDTIVRYNHTTKKYENRTADTVTPNADFTEWVVKIRPGIKFSDGTDYDAAAVVFGMQRHRSGVEGGPTAANCAEFIACPRNTTVSNAIMPWVKTVIATDALTVKFTLTEPWAGFPYLLATEPGMIPSPTALKKCDGTKPPRECAFSLKPVGAGPFTVTSFTPKESIVMARNAGYWGGQVYLDGLKFTNAGDGGGTKTYESFKAGQLQAAFLRAPDAVASAKADKVPGWSTMNQMGAVLRFNTGLAVNCAGQKPEPVCIGRPDGPGPVTTVTKDVKVRQAIVAAIDPKVVDQRANNGKGLPGTELLQSDFPWYPTGVQGTPKYDPDLAKKLVAEAKAAGWDGKVRLLYQNSPTGQNTGLAVQSLLQAVGIDAQLDATKDVGAFVAQYLTNRDFDVVGTGTSVSPDDGAMVNLAQNFASNSGSNVTGFKSPIVDAALKELRAASTDDQKKAAYKRIVEELYAQAPTYAWSKVEELTIWSPKVHGITETMKSTVLFDKAWIEK